MIAKIEQLIAKHDEHLRQNAVGGIHGCNHGKGKHQLDTNNIVMAMYVPTYSMEVRTIGHHNSTIHRHLLAISDHFTRHK